MAVRLGLDASQMVASCAVSTDAVIVASLTMDRAIENFTILIRKTLETAKIDLRELDEIVVCTGPGSQTGIRAAVVTGNALAMALNIPVSGVLSTDAAAIISVLQKDAEISDESQEQYQVAVVAGRSRWYMDTYHWNDGKLNRLGKLLCVDELPIGMRQTFLPYAVDINLAGDIRDKVFETKSCAYGALLIAETQRYLLEPSSAKEIVLYGGEKSG